MVVLVVFEFFLFRKDSRNFEAFVSALLCLEWQQSSFRLRCGNCYRNCFWPGPLSFFLFFHLTFPAWKRSSKIFVSLKREVFFINTGTKNLLGIFYIIQPERFTPYGQSLRISNHLCYLGLRPMEVVQMMF